MDLLTLAFLDSAYLCVVLILCPIQKVKSQKVMRCYTPSSSIDKMAQKKPLQCYNNIFVQVEAYDYVAGVISYV